MRDETPRYAPDKVMVVNGSRHGYAPVVAYRAHPPNAHPIGCPLVSDCTALELITASGSRWYGCDRAWINSELRMAVQGFPARFEEIATWTPCEVQSCKSPYTVT